VERPQKTGTWNTPHGGNIHVTQTIRDVPRTGFFEDVPRNVPTLCILARGWIPFSGWCKHPQCILARGCFLHPDVSIHCVYSLVDGFPFRNSLIFCKIKLSSNEAYIDWIYILYSYTYTFHLLHLLLSIRLDSLLDTFANLCFIHSNNGNFHTLLSEMVKHPFNHYLNRTISTTVKDKGFLTNRHGERNHPNWWRIGERKKEVSFTINNLLLNRYEGFGEGLKDFTAFSRIDTVCKGDEILHVLKSLYLSPLSTSFTGGGELSEIWRL
jgi:hypothetical protein